MHCGRAGGDLRRRRICSGSLDNLHGGRDGEGFRVDDFDGRSVVAVITALVDLEGVDGPVCLAECFRVVLNVVLAATGQGGASTVLAPYTAGPIAAEGSVEDEVVVHEVLVDVAVVAADEAGCGGSPVAGSGVRAGDIAWDAATREEPDVDVAARPLHGIDPATGIVEVGAIVVGAGGFDGATKATLATAAGEGAPVARVHCHLVLAAGVDAFNDVDFAAVGPIRACHPKCGPCPADTAGHMGKV